MCSSFCPQNSITHSFFPFFNNPANDQQMDVNNLGSTLIIQHFTQVTVDPERFLALGKQKKEGRKQD